MPYIICISIHHIIRCCMWVIWAEGCGIRLFKSMNTMIHFNDNEKAAGTTGRYYKFVMY